MRQKTSKGSFNTTIQNSHTLIQKESFPQYLSPARTSRKVLMKFNNSHGKMKPNMLRSPSELYRDQHPKM